MATEVGALYYDLTIDDKKLKSQLDSADAKIKSFGDKVSAVGHKMTNVGKRMSLGLTLPIVAGFGAAIKAASDLNETMNKTEVAFKDQADAVKAWAADSIKSMGLARQSAMDAAALFGDMSTAMGLSTGQAAKMSMSLVQLGADLASFKNIPFEQAQTALAGIFTGETESLKRLGIVMTEANLQQFALTKGINESLSEMTQAEKVQLRYAYVMSVTTNAQGDFERTAGGTANQMRMAQERFKEVSAVIGAHLLPIVNKFLEKLGVWVERFRNLSPATQKVILAILAVVAVLGPTLVIMGQLILAIKGIALAFAFVAAHPAVLAITLAVMAIAALAFLVIENWDTVKQWFSDFWGWLKDAASTAWTAIKDFASAAVDFYVNKVIGSILNIIEWWRSLPGRIVKISANFGMVLWNAGRDLIQGLIDGATSLLSNIGKFFLDKLPGWIREPFKKALGIGSPSKLFAEYGRNIAQGLVKGVGDGLPDIGSAFAKMPTVALTGMAEGINNSRVYNNNTHVQIGTINDRNDADYLLRRVDRNQQLEGMGLSPVRQMG